MNSEWKTFKQTGPSAQECFEQFDSKGKMKVVNYIKKKCIKINPDDYGPDVLLVMPGKNPVFVEVQMNSYFGDPEKESKIREFLIPQRKERLKTIPNCEIWIVANDLSKAAIIPVSKLTDDRKVIRPNKFQVDEVSFSIPISECKIFSLSTIR